MDQNGITVFKMTMALIDINEILVSDFSGLNHKGLGPIMVRLGSRFHGLHLVGQIFTFDITEMNKKGLRL